MSLIGKLRGCRGEKRQSGVFLKTYDGKKSDSISGVADKS